MMIVCSISLVTCFVPSCCNCGNRLLLEWLAAHLYNSLTNSARFRRILTQLQPEGPSFVGVSWAVVKSCEMQQGATGLCLRLHSNLRVRSRADAFMECQNACTVGSGIQILSKELKGPNHTKLQYQYALGDSLD